MKQRREELDSVSDEDTEDFYDAEILDEITTSRGEFKLRAISFNEDRFSQVSIAVCCLVSQVNII